MNKKTDKDEHKILANWAADCAGHVLSGARKFAFAAHAAARDAIRPESIAAARSAGHAAATAHVPNHAKYVASYAVKASVNPKAERDWQLQKLPDHFKSMIFQ